MSIEHKHIMETFKNYKIGKSNFKNSHKCSTCKCCGCEIIPGSDIFVEPMTSDEIYCSAECFLEGKGGVKLIYNEGDEEYASWFDVEEVL